MSEVDGWSDSQIREKFEELGCPAPPITATTKKIMIKRLKTLMDRKGNPITKPHEEPEPEDEDEPDALPLPPTRIPRRLGRSALAAMNQTNQSMNPLDSISPILNGGGVLNKTRSKSPGRKSFGRMEPSPVPPPSPPRASPSRQSQTETRSKSPGRKSLGRASDFMTPEANEEIQRPARKVTPSRRAQETESFSNQRGVSPSRLSSAERIIQEARESAAREAVANEAFRSRLLDSPSLNFESNYMKRLSTPIRKNIHSTDNDEVLSDDEDSLTSPVRVVRGNKPSGYEVRSGKVERVFPVAIFFAFLIPFTILIGFFAMFYGAPQANVTNTNWSFQFVLILIQISLVEIALRKMIVPLLNLFSKPSAKL
uniref:Otefin n=1 Tax=Lygus hesperus TaxID=30085 RepID=A0A0A9ZBJ2_LYGHE